ncbi:Vinorine synthase [Vitis vinifera]|uniref:Vinorine synthase n=1 Tax=Vitis vinifera TaxID=29760 RepID=A0A438DMJ6_VITVI|nr:Vinorine synthase [Vitis vinifera]
MEVQMLSTKLIKPSSPTPSHLRTLKLSPIDQLFTYTTKPSAIYYYSAESSSRSEDVERRNRLETSLSETLTRFYPLAGRYIKDSHSVDCNDEGAEYLEAKVEGQLSQLLSRRDEMIYQLVHLSGGQSTSPVTSIQITRFDCGGLVIGVRIHHIVVDGFTAASFVTAWATASREGVAKASPKISETNKVVTWRFVFDGAKISSLKARAHDPSFQREPSRVAVVTALIWRALMGVSKAKHGRLRTSLASHSINLRPKIVPPLPPLCCGNLTTRYKARFTADDSNGELPDLKELVGLLRDATKSNAAMHREDMYSTVIKSRNELHEDMEDEEVDVFLFSSWSRLSFHDADFGWGKPVWVSKIHFPADQIFLLDGEGGDGIDAWVGLNKQDMLQLQQDGDIMAFTCSV